MAEDCEKETFYSVADTFGGPKPLVPCNPAAERIPDELHEPDGLLDNPPAYKSPEPVLVGNRLSKASCRLKYEGTPDSEAYGNGTVVPPYTYTAYVYLRESFGISAEVLDHIAGGTLVDDLGALFHEKYGTVGRDELLRGIAALLSVSNEAGGMVYDALESEQVSLDVAAGAQANAELECYWLNHEIVQYCRDIGDYDEEDLATRYDHKDASTAFMVPAGLVRSEIGQVDADTHAEAMARDKLNCFYVSDPVTVHCTDSDRPGKPDDGGDEEVPVEKVSLVEGRKPRNGTVSLPKGMFTSKTSREDATEKARRYAYSLLVCYYFNSYTRRRCGLSEARAQGVDPLEEEPEKAVLAVRSKGQEVVVPTGYITSSISTEDADNMAAALADSLLECCFISPEVKRTCPSIHVVDAQGEPVLDESGKQVVVDPSDKEEYAVPERIIERGTFFACDEDDPTSRESNKAVVDYLRKQAEDAAGGDLYCTYCNRMVLPTCVPDWVIKAVTTGIELPSGGVYRLSLPLDLDNVLDPYTGEPVDTSSWSLDSTVGMSADMYCSRDYYTAQQLAEEAASELVDLQKEAEDDTCVFENCIVHATCAAENPYMTADCEGSYRTSEDDMYNGYYRQRGVRSELCGGGEYIWLSATRWKSRCQVAESSTPPPCDYITVAAGAVKVSIAQTPGTIPKGEPGYDYDTNARMAYEYANKLAMDMAMQMVCCQHPPTTVIGYCGRSSATQTETKHGVYDDMPVYRHVSEGMSSHDMGCCGCEKTYTVVKDNGLECLTDFSNDESNPIVMDYTPQGCFNTRPVTHATTMDGNVIGTYDSCEESDEGVEGTYESHNSFQDVVNTVKSLTQCFYGNKPVTGWCYAEGGEKGSDTEEDIEVVSNEVEIPENTIITDLCYTSQIIAEQLADGMAQCSYGNVSVKAKCKCKKSEYKDQLEKWEYLRAIVPFKCGKVKKNTIFASSPYLARRIAEEMAEMLTVCRMKPCEDNTPFHVSYKCDPEDPCDDIEDEKKRKECERKEKLRELDYSDCVLKMNQGMVYLSNGTVVNCPEMMFPKGTIGQLSVQIVRDGPGGDYRCVHLVNGRQHQPSAAPQPPPVNPPSGNQPGQEDGKEEEEKPKEEDPMNPEIEVNIPPLEPTVEPIEIPEINLDLNLD